MNKNQKYSRRSIICIDWTITIDLDFFFVSVSTEYDQTIYIIERCFHSVDLFDSSFIFIFCLLCTEQPCTPFHITIIKNGTYHTFNTLLYVRIQIHNWFIKQNSIGDWKSEIKRSRMYDDDLDDEEIVNTKKRKQQRHLSFLPVFSYRKSNLQVVLLFAFVYAW